MSESRRADEPREATEPQVSSEEPGPDEASVREEEERAAAEAGRIGGRSGMEGMDEAQRAAAEQGGGEAEGFEQAEELLEEQATHGDPDGNPLQDAARAEEEQDPAVHGESDAVDSTETGEDTQGTPEEG